MWSTNFHIVHSDFEIIRCVFAFQLEIWEFLAFFFWLLSWLREILCLVSNLILPGWNLFMISIKKLMIAYLSLNSSLTLVRRGLTPLHWPRWRNCASGWNCHLIKNCTCLTTSSKRGRHSGFILAASWSDKICLWAAFCLFNSDH